MAAPGTDVPRVAMQTWARLYLSAAAVEQAVIALVLLTQPGVVLVPTNRHVSSDESAALFGCAFVLVSLSFAVAATLQRSQLAHLTLVTSAFVLTAGAAGLLADNLLNDANSLLAAMLWASLAARDLIVTRAPLVHVAYPPSSPDVIGVRRGE
jgi:hypothetical protein